MGGNDCFRAYGKSDFLMRCSSEAERGRFFADGLMERYGTDTYEEAGVALKNELSEIRRQFMRFCARETRFVLYGMGQMGRVLAERYQELRRERKLNWELCRLRIKK